MTLVDTSVWIDHFRNKNKKLIVLLEENKVLTHSFIIGELACGNIKNRNEILNLLKTLPFANEPTNEEVLVFIEKRNLYGKGLGFIDIHILSSALLNNSNLYTLDKKLQKEWLKITDFKS
ncbi:MAG: PIN domain-containing protein [Spirochaetia bacterium]|nr:PIN domain-containing protein [Spirochaetia bacterium]